MKRGLPPGTAPAILPVMPSFFNLNFLGGPLSTADGYPLAVPGAAWSVACRASSALGPPSCLEMLCAAVRRA